MKRILVVEDNPTLAAGLRMNLLDAGYRAELAADGEQALSIIRTGGVDLVVLDLMLPGLDGVGVLQALRNEAHRMPVLVLTARGDESAKVEVLAAGADDHVTKPFGLRELMARIHALLRRTDTPRATTPETPLVYGELAIRPGTQTVLRAGRPVKLRPREFELLLVLARRPREVLLRTELLQQIWGYQPDVSSRTLDTHVAILRRKLERDAAHPRHFVTVHKLGYRFDP